MPQHSTMKIVKQQKVSSQVYDQLLERIKNHKWEEGTKLPSENELRLEMGVSRISIREAMQKLTALGIVETRQGEGSFVKKATSDSYKDMMLPMFMINKNSLEEILEYRRVMEVGATEIAAGRITASELAEMEAIVERMEHNDSDVKTFSHDDMMFHMAISKATKNQMPINVSVFMQDLLGCKHGIHCYPFGHEGREYFHRLILEEIEEREQGGSGSGHARARGQDC